MLWWLYFIGLFGVIGCVVMVVVIGYWLWLLVVVVCGYGFVWVGYFFFEKNCLVMFWYLIYSLMGDWVMFKDICIGKILLQLLGLFLGRLWWLCVWICYVWCWIGVVGQVCVCQLVCGDQ